MAETLTDDAVGKTVVDAAGKELGIVGEVDREGAHVNPNPSLAQHAMSKFGWERTGDDDYLVTEDMLDRIADDEVVLRGEI